MRCKEEEKSYLLVLLDLALLKHGEHIGGSTLTLLLPPLGLLGCLRNDKKKVKYMSIHTNREKIIQRKIWSSLIMLLSVSVTK